MSLNLAMIQADLKAGPGADFGKTLTFEQSAKRGRSAFALTAVPVSGIPYEESGKVEADFDNWTAQAVVCVDDCPYRPDVGQLVNITDGPRCRIVRVTPDATGALYALELEPMTRA